MPWRCGASSSPIAGRSLCGSCAPPDGLGIETVLAASAADRDSMAAREADRVVVLGPAAARASYLDAAPHRSCGQSDGLRRPASRLWLSFGTSPRLRDLCDEEGVVFVGPTSGLYRGGRRQTLGSAPREGGRRRDDAGQRQARHRQPRRSPSPKAIGFPVVTKASAGGGGRGMVVARDAKSLADGFERASIEAKEAFGDGTLYVERYRRARASRRGAGPGARRRARAAFRRARLLDAAPLSEDGRGGARRGAAGATRSAAAQGGGRSPRVDPLPQRRHGRVSLRRRPRRFLFHGSQCAHPGRASRLGDDHRRRPRPAAARSRGRRAAPHRAARHPSRAATRSRRASSPRIQIAALRRRPDGSALATSPRRRRTARHGDGGGRLRAALLRQHDRQADRPRGRPAGSGRAAARRAGSIRGRGHRDQHRATPRDRRASGFHRQSPRHAMAGERASCPQYGQPKEA